MNQLGLRFHHIGLAVPRIEDSLPFIRELGYQVGEVVHDPLQKVRLAMCKHASSPALEIIAPESPDARGPVTEMVKKNASGIVYHMCYSTGDLAATLAAAEAMGLTVRCVSEPKPAVLFGGQKVSFYWIFGMGLIEIVEQENAVTANEKNLTPTQAPVGT
jgi:methylmalonyl-CoA/ethylmalonyl-CoA epimerase